MLVQSFQRDWVALLEILTLLAAFIESKKTFGPSDDTIFAIDRSCQENTGFPLALIKRTAPEELLCMLKHGSNSDAKSLFLADLLSIYAKYQEENGHLPEALTGQLQACCLLGESLNIIPSNEQSIYRSKLASLAHKLEKVASDPYVAEKLERYRTTLL